MGVAGAASEDDAVRVSGLLKGPRQVFDVHRAMGCLIPLALDPRLDGVKPRGKARAGATTPGVKIYAGKWNINVEEVRDLGLDDRPLPKGVFEFFLVLLRRISRSMQLPVAVGSVGLGPTILGAASGVGLAVEAEGMTLWKGEGGLRDYFADKEEIWLPVNRDVGPFVKDCVLVTVKSDEDGQVLRNAKELRVEVYDRIRRQERSR